jgi:LCP family protein required for cell wall assembly
MNEPPENQQDRPRTRLPLWGVAGLLFLLLVFALSAVWVFRQGQNLGVSWTVTGREFSPGRTTPPQTDAQSADSAALPLPEVSEADTGTDGTIQNDEILTPWQGSERVNILLLGIDQRCDEDGPTHTDTMMVVSIDPVGMSASALSLPRDMWVQITNFGLDRINQAHFIGGVSNYPGGGPALAAETVEAFLGLPIHYYGAANFDAFTEFIDLIGGIDIDVPEDINDPKYPDRCYGFDPFQISAGTHHLNGEQALKYARTRATFGGDVDRAGRQQQVLLAVRDAILSLDMVPRLLAQAPEIWQSLQKNVRTNMTIEEAIQLGLLAQDIPRENIRLQVIDFSYILPGITADAQQVLLPRRDRIRLLRDDLFAPAPVPPPVIEDLSTRAAEENARVAILNGTPVFGLAAETQDYLRQNNINVVEIGNADASTYATTRIFTYGDFPYTTGYLAQLLDLPPLNVRDGVNDGAIPAGNYDILIILGQDWQALTPTTTP